MRGPGCLFGSVVGLAAGAAVVAAVFVGLSRWAPGVIDQARRFASGRDAADSPGASGLRESEAAAQGKVAAGDTALRIRVRHRLRKLEAEARTGTPLRVPVEFTEAEIQAALSDPEGPLRGAPRNLDAELLPGKVRLSWPIFPGRESSGWLAPLASVEASLDLEPRIEKGRLVCPPVAGRVAGVPVPRRLIADLAPSLPAAPRLPPAAGFALPPGASSVEVLAGRLRLEPAPAPATPPKR